MRSIGGFLRQDSGVPPYRSVFKIPPSHSTSIMIHSCIMIHSWICMYMLAFTLSIQSIGRTCKQRNANEQAACRLLLIA